MNTFPRYFAFGSRYAVGEDYIRCDRPDQCVVVAPGVGETSADEELPLDRCLEFVQRGVLIEMAGDAIDRRVDRRTRPRTI